MSIPLFFLPKVMASGLMVGGSLNRSLLESRGLSESLADVNGINDLCQAEVCGKGPSGDPGLIVGALPIATRESPRWLGFFPSEQSWTKISDSLWVGIDKVFPPAPVDLARKESFPGYKIKLGDGNEWEVPVIRDFGTRSPRLPRDMYFDENGGFAMQLRSEYSGIWEQTERIARLFFDPKSEEYGSINLDQALKISISALSLNYRIGMPEQRALRLVTSTNWEQVLGAMVDWPLFEEYLRKESESSKKNEMPFTPPVTENSTHGDGDSCQTTDPAGENCNS